MLASLGFQLTVFIACAVRMLCRLVEFQNSKLDSSEGNCLAFSDGLAILRFYQTEAGFLFSGNIWHYQVVM